MSTIPTGQEGPGAPNNSGMGPQSTLPPELQGLNWGGFLLSWIWGIGHSTWLALLALVPYVGWVMSIVLLIKGNEWAWQNRKWESIQQFRDVQAAWTKWGIIVLIAAFVLGIV